MMLKWFEDLHALSDALGICFFPTHMRLSMGPNSLSHLYSAYTGWETTAEDMMNAGERIFNLFKAYTVRAGLTRKDDSLPDKSYEGAEISKDFIERFLDEYYVLRGWDLKKGVPTKAKLVELGLEQTAQDLARSGKLP